MPRLSTGQCDAALAQAVWYESIPYGGRASSSHSFLPILSSTFVSTHWPTDRITFNALEGTSHKSYILLKYASCNRLKTFSILIYQLNEIQLLRPHSDHVTSNSFAYLYPCSILALSPLSVFTSSFISPWLHILTTCTLQRTPPSASTILISAEPVLRTRSRSRRNPRSQGYPRGKLGIRSWGVRMRKGTTRREDQGAPCMKITGDLMRPEAGVCDLKL